MQREAKRLPTRTQTVRILLVEDEPVTSQVFARALQRNGHHVRVAKDGMQAMHALRDETPDVVWSHLGLPTMPGPEVALALR